ncbi:putative geraniol 8-hydroxylase [Rosa chinensis]|uniref:Putative geraniol 8-hydroxylase n=1 Tax=Rosa chinensis TaxID=74649 RepID=A0A2P6R0P1_ROSCH|nr:putative geraniol 8-hydroxylase [Rosa chinensis]
MSVSPRWRKLRKICSSQLFATKVLDANQANRRVKVQVESMVHGVAVDIEEAAFKTIVNLLSRTIFSFELAATESSSSEMARGYNEIVWGLMEEVGKPNLGDYFPMLPEA